MRKIVLRFGLASGVILIVLFAVTLPFGVHSEVVGYTAMVLSLLLVFFGIRSYRETVAGGAIGFGKALQVGILITLITCAMYVIGWEIAFFNFFPDFFHQYSAHVLAKMHASGASAADIAKTAAQLNETGKHYDNVFYNSAVTFMEIFPVGLVVTLVSAAILRRKPRTTPPMAAAAA